MSVPDADRTALVVGAGGLVGTHLVERLLDQGWDVIGVSRRPVGVDAPRFRHLAVDILDAAQCRRTAAQLDRVTHVFFTARIGHREAATENALNVNALNNTLEHLLAESRQLQHVCLVHGTKWYGSHLGAFPNPAIESQTPHAGENWYFGQHDRLTDYQRRVSWTWSTVRPHIVIGVSVGHPYNCLSTLAAYALLCRERQRPFTFPGSDKAFNAVTQATDASLLADAQIWSSITRACANHDFNVINADYFRWNQLWPVIADYFAIQAEGPDGVSLCESMRDAQPDWQRLIKRYGLQTTSLDDLASWSFGDFLFRTDWDVMSSTVKTRQFGFDPVIATRDSFLHHLGQMREQRLIP